VRRLARALALLATLLVAALAAAPQVLAHGRVQDAHHAAGSPLPAWLGEAIALGVPALALVAGLLALERATRPPAHLRGDPR